MMSRKLAATAAISTWLLAACSQEQAAAPAPEAQVEAPGEAIAEAETPIAEAPPEAPAAAGLEKQLPIFVDAAAFETFCADTLASARAQFEALEAMKGDGTVEGTYGPVNQLTMTFSLGASVSSLYQNVYPDEAVRTAAEKCEQDFSSLGTDISLSRPIYEAVSAVDASGADGATQFSLMKTIRDYTRSGVDKDEATRAKIRTLIEEITLIGQDFGRNIRDDVRFIEIEPAKLAGLPDDYVEGHPAGDNGLVKITTDYPDYVPFLTYAQDDEARRQLRVAARSVAYPKNEQVLMDLLKKRDELAKLLGFQSYAHYITADKMVGTPERAKAFIDDIASTVKAAAERDKSILLERLKQIDPNATNVEIWQYNYLKNLLTQEKYNVDTKLLRTYFRAGKVKQGIFDLTSDLFGIEIRDADMPVWDDSVTAHEIWQDGQKIGLFYLDLYPREGKYKHAAHWGVIEGIGGVQLPVSTLVCNFPGKDDPDALMEFDDVSTFLHEFGHLLHHQFSGKGEWVNNSGTSTEWDFVEAPSQMLEEWAYDYDTLKTFAVNAEGETIPEDLVKQLNKARFFGVGIDTAIQTFYAALSLEYYTRDPASFELLPLMKDLENTYGPFPYVDGTYFFANFGHLDGYSAIYYTYQWSLAIATDMFSRFNADGMRNTQLSREYRQDVLDPGGSKPADVLVEDFLGRPFTADAYKTWLTQTE